MIRCESVFGNVFQFAPNQYAYGSVFLWCWQVNDGYRLVICGPEHKTLILDGTDQTVYRICRR